MYTNFTTELWTAVTQGYRVAIMQGSTKKESGRLDGSGMWREARAIHFKEKCPVVMSAANE